MVKEKDLINKLISDYFYQYMQDSLSRADRYVTVKELIKIATKHLGKDTVNVGVTNAHPIIKRILEGK